MGIRHTLCHALMFIACHKERAILYSGFSSQGRFMHRILILNGPNLNMLGTREPDVYGRATLDDINQQCLQDAKTLGMTAQCRQSNDEATLIQWCQDARGTQDALILNPAGLTHTSVALRDAVAASALPCVEVHLTNPHTREHFRHFSYISGVAIGVICGFGPHGYTLALQTLAKHLQNHDDAQKSS